MDPRILKKTFDGAKSGARYLVAITNTDRGIETLAYLWKLHQEYVICLDDPCSCERALANKSFCAEKNRVQGFILLRSLPTKVLPGSTWNLREFIKHLSGVSSAIKGGELTIAFTEDRDNLEQILSDKNVDVVLYAENGIVDYANKVYWDDILRTLIYNGKYFPVATTNHELTMHLMVKVKLIFVE